MLGWALVVLGLLWAAFAGVCQGLGVVMAFETPNPADRPSWLILVPAILWVLPGVVILLAGVAALRAGRQSAGRSLTNGAIDE